MHSPPIGWPIVCYLRGDVSTGAVAASVTESTDQGQLKAKLHFAGEGWTTPTFIRHTDDPWVADHPNIFNRPSTYTWGYIAGLEAPEPPPVVEPDPPTAEETEDKKEIGRQKVLQLLKTGADWPAVAKSVRGYGLSADEVREIAETLPVK